MKIGWIVSVTGMFGAVREYVEMSNALTRLGHTVTVYSAEGKKPTWLAYAGQVGTFADAAQAHDDVLIMVTDWRRTFYDAFMAASPRLRCVCVMGFDPSETLADMLTGRDALSLNDPAVMRDALHLPGVLVLCDSTWQIEWLTANVGVQCGPPIGGVNLTQFHPVKGARAAGPPWRVLATGDPRPRKGSNTVQRAVDLLKASGARIELVTYWNKRLAQGDMAAWYSSGHVFLDAERRAGWANPVAEAMACGTACVTTDIGGVHDYAIHERTALLVPVDDAAAMARAADRLLEDVALRQRLINHGYERIQAYSYDRMALPLAMAFEERLNA